MAIYTVTVYVSAVLQLLMDKTVWLLRHTRAPKHFILQSLCCLLKILMSVRCPFIDSAVLEAEMQIKA